MLNFVIEFMQLKSEISINYTLETSREIKGNNQMAHLGLQNITFLENKIKVSSYVILQFILLIIF